MRVALRLLFAALAVLAASEPARAEQRVAMVVGIDAYPNLGPEAQLQRAVSDADSVSASLRRLGFAVTTLAKGTTVTQDDFDRQFSIFEHSIHSGDIAVFYFAGHGVSVDRSNYLVPADVPELADPDTHMLRRHTVDEAEIRERMQNRGPAVVLLMLDACRNNPFRSRERGMMSRGLQPMQASNGVLTIYAAGEGQAALDRLSDVDDRNPNSVFTRVVLKELERPGLNLVDFGEDVRDNVAAIAREAGREQIPEVVNHLVGGRSVYLGSAPAPTPPPPPGPSADEVAWSYVQGTADPAALRRFLAQFPDSRRQDEARARLASLERLAPMPAPSATLPAEPPADEAAWRRASTATDPAQMRAFLLRYPASPRRTEAAEWLRVFDDTMWRDTPAGDATAQRHYLELFPAGAHGAEARARLASLEQPPARAEPAHVAHPPVYRPRHVIQPAPPHAVVPTHRIVRQVQVVVHEAPPRPAIRPARRSGGCFTFAGESHCQ